MRRKNHPDNFLVSIAVFLIAASIAMGDPPLSLTLVPWSGTPIAGGAVIEVEAFLTANVSLVIAGGQHDLSCSLVPYSGSSGTLVTIDGTANPDGVGGSGPSRSGVPHLYAPMEGISLFIASSCLFFHSGGLGAVAIFAPGSTRYLGTHFVQISECAVGKFEMQIEGLSNPPTFNDSTFFYSAQPPNQRFQIAPTSLLITVPGGSCCDGDTCLADNINEFCCQQTYPGARWYGGRSCADAAPCPDCVQDEECNDWVFCNGAEHCDPETGTCQPSPPPTCDDGVACTADSCDAELDECTHTLFDPACDDGVFCNGEESCDGIDGCRPGTPPTCVDGIACTTDSCDVLLDECVNSPSNAACDDGLFCNGAETCDATAGCQAGAPPCAGSVPVDGATVFLECDETADTCVTPPIPTVSTWGLITLALVILTIAKLRRIAPPGLSGR